jgi:hypothetical protein
VAGTYFAEARNTTTGCTSTTRTAVTLTIHPNPPAPSSGGDKSICADETIPALTVNVGTGETADWYAGSTGGTALATGTTSYTPTAAGTYYAEARDLTTGCTSISRTGVTLIINNPPEILLQPISPPSVCAEDGCVSFSVQFSGTGIICQWQAYTTDWNDISDQGVYNGATTAILTITNPPLAMDGYHYRCVLSGVCPPVAITDGNAMLTVNPLPGPANDISGYSNVCQSDVGVVYSVPEIENTTSYSWSYTGEGIIINGNSSSVQIDFSNSATSGNLSVYGMNDCGNGIISDNFPIIVNPLPNIQDDIFGLTDACQGSIQGYKVDNMEGITFEWSVPDGWVLIEGQGTDSITTQVGLSNGLVQVTPYNYCGEGVTRVLEIFVLNQPLQPSPITGLCNPCQGSEQIYSVQHKKEVVYNWQLPSDWTLIEGYGTNKITVEVGNQSGIIKVTPSNVCGIGPARTLDVIASSMPGQPSFIAGTSDPCQGSAQTFSVTNIPGMSYNWQVPADWIITAGQGTNSITTTVGIAAGSILVTPSNPCGTGPARSLAVTVSTLPAQPSAISGLTDPCEGTTQVYSVTETPGIDYGWQLPADWSILTGQESHSVTVMVGTVSGTVQVIPSNFCGSGPSRSLSVNTIPLPGQPSPIVGPIESCRGTQQSYSVADLAGMTYIWQVPPDWTIDAGQGTHSITVTSGMSGEISVFLSNSCGSGPTEILVVTIISIPEETSVISGLSEPCEGSTQTYSVEEEPGVVYTWEVPADWIISVGQGTHSISVVVGSTGGEVRVVPSNVCGSAPASVLDVTVNPIPSPAGVITGDVAVCLNETGVIYTVPAVVNATSYEWILPSGASGSSSTNSIVVDYTSGAISGYLTVSGVNECGNGPSSSLWITVNDLPFEHVLTIPVGWSGISIYIDPTDDSVEDIFATIVNELIILNDGDNHIYWPALEINTIQTWSGEKGYFIETTQQVELTFKGCADMNKTLSLGEGWNVIPVLSAAPVTTSDLFEPLGDVLIIVVEIAGPGIYWPAMDVNSLPYLYPGKAYQVRVTQSCTITFP